MIKYRGLTKETLSLYHTSRPHNCTFIKLWAAITQKETQRETHFEGIVIQGDTLHNFWIKPAVSLTCVTLPLQVSLRYKHYVALNTCCLPSVITCQLYTAMDTNLQLLSWDTSGTCFWCQNYQCLSLCPPTRLLTNTPDSYETPLANLPIVLYVNLKTRSCYWHHIQPKRTLKANVTSSKFQYQNLPTAEWISQPAILHGDGRFVI